MYNIFNEDCISGMKKLDDNSIDFICADLPYNLTDCAWDKSIIDLSAMWTEIKRILKPYCSVALFASSKFTFTLYNSNPEWYKYKWIWIKNTPTMFVHAKNAPMRKYEEILIFSDGAINHKSCSNRRMKYNPQGVVDTQLRGGGKYFHSTHKVSDVSLQGGKPKGNAERCYHCHGDWERSGRLKAFGNVLGKRPSQVDYYIQEQTGYPTDILYFNTPHNVGKLHPSQKPVALLEYLIRTYTNEGETVLDATMGSGSAGVAAVNTSRNFIGYEIDKNFFGIAQKRIEEAQAKKAQELF